MNIFEGRELPSVGMYRVKEALLSTIEREIYELNRSIREIRESHSLQIKNGHLTEEQANNSAALIDMEKWLANWKTMLFDLRRGVNELAR